MYKNRVAPGESSGSFNEPKYRSIKEVLEGKATTVFMALVTLWVLFGDDLRLIATAKSADEAYYISFTVCLCLFVLELALNALFVEEYKLSFFF